MSGTVNSLATIPTWLYGRNHVDVCH